MLKTIAIYIAIIGLTQTALMAETIVHLGETYYNCEKDYTWIKNKQLGYGPYGYVHIACSKEDPKNCQFAAKVQRIGPDERGNDDKGFERESAILKKLGGKGIAPNLYESFTCKIKNNRNGAVRSVGVIVLDRFDKTLFDLLNLEFDDFLIKKFGDKGKATAYYIKSLQATNPTNKAVTQLPVLKNGLVRANEALKIGRTRNLKPNKDKFLAIPESETITNLLASLEPLLVKLAENKIIHRDMKVDNIMYKDIGGEKQPIIIDYGLAYDTEREDDVLPGNLNGYWDETFQVVAPGTQENKSTDPRDFCYDRVLLEVELFQKYGLNYKFKSVDDACRKYIYDTYLESLLPELTEIYNPAAPLPKPGI